MFSSNNILRKALLVKYWLLMSTGLAIVFMMALYKADLFKIKEGTTIAINSIRGDEAYGDKRWGDAGIFYQADLKLSPGDLIIQYNLANAYYQQGRYPEAAQLYIKVLKQKNNNLAADTWNNLGLTYYQMDVFDKSLNSMKQALLLNDKDEQVRQNFLVVMRKVMALTGAGGMGKKGKEKKADSESDNKENRPGDKDGEKSLDDQQLGTYQVSDKQMNNLLKMSEQHERVPTGTRASKQKVSNNTNGPDY